MRSQTGNSGNGSFSRKLSPTPSFLKTAPGGAENGMFSGLKRAGGLFGGGKDQASFNTTAHARRACRREPALQLQEGTWPPLLGPAQSCGSCRSPRAWGDERLILARRPNSPPARVKSRLNMPFSRAPPGAVFSKNDGVGLKLSRKEPFPELPVDCASAVELVASFFDTGVVSPPADSFRSGRR